MALHSGQLKSVSVSLGGGEMKIRQEIPTPQLAGVLRAEAQPALSHSQSRPHTERGRTRARPCIPPPRSHRLAFPRRCCLTKYDKVDAGKSAGGRASASCCTRAGPELCRQRAGLQGEVLSVRAGNAPAPRPPGEAGSCPQALSSGARPSRDQSLPSLRNWESKCLSLAPSSLRYFGYTTRSD